MSFRTVLQLWNKFWFEPSSPTPIALFRIFLGLVMLQDAVFMRLGDWRLYYSTHPLIPLKYYISNWWGRDPRFDMMSLLPESDYARLAFLGLYILLLLFVTLGFYTRVSAIGALLLNESLFNQFLLNLCGADVYLKLCLMMIACSNAGDAFSLDNIRRTFKEDWRKTGFRPPLKAQWALRMVQLQIAYAYLITGLCKLGEPRWVDGTVLYYVVRYEDLSRFQAPFLYHNMLLTKLLDWMTLVFELAFPFLIWIKEIRYFLLLWGVLFHLGIDWTVNIPLFEWIFMGTFLTYVYPEDLTRVMNYLKLWVRKVFGPAHVIKYNPYELGQIKLAGVLHRLDVFGRFAIEPLADLPPVAASTLPGTTTSAAAARHHRPMQLIAGGKVFQGFEAFKIMALNLPMFWVTVPFLFIPVLSFIARQIFLFVSGGVDDEDAGSMSKAVGVS